MDKTIWLIRHGESEANAGLPSSDPSAVPLTDNGRCQAEQVAGSFLRKPSLIAVSRFLRARQTAQPLRDRFRDVPYEEWDVQEFTYLSPERCRTTTVLDRLPFVEPYWEQCDPHYCDGEGAESFFQLIERVKQTAERIQKCRKSFITIFSHKQFIAAFLWYLRNTARPIDSAAMRDYKKCLDDNDIPNAAVIKVGLEREVFYV